MLLVLGSKNNCPLKSLFHQGGEEIMTEQDKPIEGKKVQCETCLKEIPVSGAKVDESADYVRYFCGPDCFEKWKQQEHKPGE